LDDGEGGARARSLAALKRAREKEKARSPAVRPVRKAGRDVVVPEAITVQETRQPAWPSAAPTW
jgi:translation initiation factor IF-2